MTFVKCDPIKSGCSTIFEINPKSVKTQEYIRCPHCGRFINNPFYDESAEKPEVSYVG